MKEQLDKQYADQDRLRLIRAAANSFQFTCVCWNLFYSLTTFQLYLIILFSFFSWKAQLVEVIRVQRYGNARNKTAILLYPNLVDPQNFESQVLPEYMRYKEDLEEVKKGLGL
jgi:hypothetical protein